MPDTAKNHELVLSLAGLTADGGVTDSALTLALVAGQEHPASAGSFNLGLVLADVQENAAPLKLGLGVGGATEHHGVTVSGAAAALSLSADDFGSDPALAGYELFHALNNAEFDFSAPAETFTSLPHITAANYGADGVHRFVVRRRNVWGLTDQNQTETAFDVVNGFAVQRPRAVLRPHLEQRFTITRNVIYANAYYYREQDSPTVENYIAKFPSGLWFWVWFTDDGSDPDPDLPADLDAAMSAVAGQARVLHLMIDPTPANGQVFKAFIAAATGPKNDGTAVHGELSPLLTLTANTSALTAPTRREIRHQRRNR